MQFPDKATSEMWGELQWSTGPLEPTTRRNEPLHVANMPGEPGIYRMIWNDAQSWETVRKTIPVKATLRIADRELEFDQLRPPALLTIGKTTNLAKRVCQHFGTNQNNNRVISRLASVLPKPPYNELIDIARSSITVEWVVIPDWIDRCLLERYGCATARPILDMEAEH